MQKDCVSPTTNEYIAGKSTDTYDKLRHHQFPITAIMINLPTQKQP